MFLLRLGLLAFVTTLFSPGLSSDQRTKYTNPIEMSSDGISMDGICIAFSAYMYSSEFDGLERIDTTTSTEFRRGKLPLTNFPDTIEILVWARPSACDPLDRKKQPKDLGNETMSSLTFRFSWKQDVELRPAEKLELLKKRFPDRNIWLFIFDVKGAGIPLEGHLILHILDKAGKEQLKLSGRL